MINILLSLIIAFVAAYIIVGILAQKTLNSCTGTSFVNHDLWFYKLSALFKENAYQKANNTLLVQSLDHFLLTNEDRMEDLLPYIHKVEFPLNLFSKYYIRDEGYVFRFSSLSQIIDEQFRNLKQNDRSKI